MMIMMMSRRSTSVGWQEGHNDDDHDDTDTNDDDHDDEL